MKLLKNIFFIVLAVLVLITLHTVFNSHKLKKTNQKTITALFELAKQTRPAPFGEPQKEPAPDIAQQIEDMLPDYTKNNTFPETIINFLDKTLGLKVTEKQIQQVPAGIAGGFSGNLIFFINDKNKKPFLVVKVFKDPYNMKSFGGFIMEASAFDIVAKLPNKELKTIFIKSIGKCTIDTKDFAIMALSLAPGTNLYDYISQILQSSHHSAKRIETLNKGIYQLGRALAELNAAHIGPKSALHPTFKKYILDAYKRMLKRLQKNNHGINVSRFKTCFKTLLDNVEKQGVVRSFAYGDAHLGNFLYEEKTKTISMIDLASLHLSANRNGNPISTAALDYTRMLDSLGIYGLTDEEYYTLKIAFHDGYVSNNGMIPSSAEMNFFQLFNRVWLAQWGLKQMEKKTAFVNDSFK